VINPVSRQRNSSDCPRRFWVLKVVVVTGAPLPLPMVAQIASWRYPLWIGCCSRFAPPVLMPQHDRRRHDREGTSDFKVEESLKEVSDVRCLV
jgi:hypothetical protein